LQRVAQDVSTVEGGLLLRRQFNVAALFREREEEIFDCRLCGCCCKGQGGIVVNNAELARLCDFLDVNAGEFESRWGIRRGEKLLMRSDENGCVFFRKDEGCFVHVAKPDICRAWPYFRGNLIDRESHALARDFCPGIPQKQTHEGFVRQGLSYLVRENLPGSSRPDEAAALQISDLLEVLAHNKGKR
jgi:Fe-S-cluster containining protein